MGSLTSLATLVSSSAVAVLITVSVVGLKTESNYELDIISHKIPSLSGPVGFVLTDGVEGPEHEV
jgi:hypothetical protein